MTCLHENLFRVGDFWKCFRLDCDFSIGSPAETAAVRCPYFTAGDQCSLDEGHSGLHRAPEHQKTSTEPGNAS